MTDSTDLTTLSDGRDLATVEAELEAASGAQFADVRIQVPLLNVVQGTTKNPPDDSKPGDFFNTVTGTVFGTDIDFLVAAFHQGRFLPGQRSPDGNTYSAGAETVVPNFWPEQYRGRVFAELPEAEETFKRLVNNEEIPWGSGPAIQTSFNYTGHVVRPEGEAFPVRLSLKSTSTKAAKKLNTLLMPLRTTWAKTVRLTTERVQGEKGPYFVVKAEGYAGEPTADQRKGAVELFLASQQVGLREVGDEPVVDAAKAEGAGDAPADEPVAPGAGQQF